MGSFPPRHAYDSLPLTLGGSDTTLSELAVVLTGFNGSAQGSTGTFTAPTDVVATSADGTITVTWTPGSGAASQVVVVNVLDDTDYCLGFNSTGSVLPTSVRG